MVRTVSCRWRFAAAVGIVVASIAAAAMARAAVPVHASPDTGTRPWSPGESLLPSDLVKALAGPERPTIVYVGFKSLFHPGHIPGATFHGPASQPEGLDDLRRFAQTLPRTSPLVIYCGCCPFEHCPNVAPAYTALREMGFTKLRVLDLPTNFATDWVEKGYPVVRQ